jgi:hypothetical protein
MQHNPLHLEYSRSVVADRARGNQVHTHPPPPPRSPNPTRRAAAETLARLAWRLDREAALRVWP